MAAVVRRFRGHFRGERPDGTTSFVAAPYVRASVGPNPYSEPTLFLIDTGADITSLGPSDAFEAYGDEYLDIDFETHPGRTEMSGVGKGPVAAVMEWMYLTLFDSAGAYLTIQAPILIFEPSPRYPGRHGNWRMPSLLGRDVLQHFRLLVDYDLQLVELSRMEED